MEEIHQELKYAYVSMSNMLMKLYKDFKTLVVVMLILNSVRLLRLMYRKDAKTKLKNALIITYHQKTVMILCSKDQEETLLEVILVINLMQEME